jgi:hypothetical protein
VRDRLPIHSPRRASRLSGKACTTSGWIEGRNIALEPRWVGEKPERLRDLAAELVRLRVDWESEGWKSGLRHGRSGSCASCGIRC